MAGIYEPEFLREQALSFGTQVLDRIPAGAADQELIPLVLELTIPDDYTPFLNAVQLHFFNRPDGADDTHARFMELVQSYCDGHYPRSRLHAQVCVLFVGHAHLLNGFERLRLMNDGRQETRRQIREWRSNVRNYIRAAIIVVLAECLLAMERLRLMPETLNSRNLDFIATTCFPLGVDSYNQFHVQVMVNPASVSDLVLPVLDEKQMLFRHLCGFVTHYFGLVTGSW